MDQSGKVSSYRALVDTSSVVAHDLCAQLHVLQFCLEELQEHVPDSGKEYLDRMGVSTHYIADLVNSFRKQLKISLSDDTPESLDKIFASAMELVKNHFFIVIEKLELNTSGDLGSFTLKDSARKSMLVIFSLYATFIEEFKEQSINDQDKMVINFSARSENPRFVRVTIDIKNTSIDINRFETIVKDAAPEKGKLRKFVGLNLLEEFRSEYSEWFSFESTAQGAQVQLYIPLYQGE